MNMNIVFDAIPSIDLSVSHDSPESELDLAIKAKLSAIAPWVSFQREIFFPPYFMATGLFEILLRMLRRVE